MADEPLVIETGVHAPDACVIWLHGLGADGHDFEPIIPELRLDPGLNIRFVFPHAPMMPVTINQGFVMRAWYDIRTADIAGEPDEKGIRASAEPLSEMVDTEMEGGIASLALASGMAAIKQATEPLVARTVPTHEDINFVSAAQVYGGTFQLFNLRMAERGAHVRWVTEPWHIEAWELLIDEDTRFLYGELPSNPQQGFFDVAAVADTVADWLEATGGLTTAA